MNNDLELDNVFFFFFFVDYAQSMIKFFAFDLTPIDFYLQNIKLLQNLSPQQPYSSQITADMRQVKVRAVLYTHIHVSLFFDKKYRVTWKRSAFTET